VDIEDLRVAVYDGFRRGVVPTVPIVRTLVAQRHLVLGPDDDRLERGCERREPSAAADYLRSVGLSGARPGVCRTDGRPPGWLRSGVSVTGVDDSWASKALSHEWVTMPRPVVLSHVRRLGLSVVGA
jgi:hypothetical protein